MKKLTREERRRRSQRRQLITYLLFLILLLAWLRSYLIMTVKADRPAMHKPEPATQDGSLPGDDTPATTRCYLTEEEIEENENELIKAALLARSHKLEGAIITFYCCEERPHICGTGTGITASGRRVTPYVSCAVEPMIPVRQSRGTILILQSLPTILPYPWASKRQTFGGVRNERKR